MAVRTQWLIFIVGLVVLATACSDSSELDDANARIAELESEAATLESSNAALESSVANLESSASELETEVADLTAENTTLSSEKADLETALSSTAQNLILQADIVGEGCMLQNAYLNDGEAKATFRVRVYDPVTGEQLDEEALENVTVALGDGQEFTLAWGAHPPDTDNDFFWTYGWEIFAGYPAGNIPYTITATAVDGRTGTFEPFNVPPSLLTVMEIEATEG